MKPVRIEVNDRMQQGYVYHLAEPTGLHFAPGLSSGAYTEGDA